MKRNILLMIFAVLIFAVVGCSSTTKNQEEKAKTDKPAKEAETYTYESETGPVEVPTHPKRIVALTNAPNVHALKGELVGMDEWTKANPLFADDLKDVPVVSEKDPESILAQQPDLIIAGSHMENLDELKKIAPTIIYTWGKLNYLDQQVEIGKLLNKEQEAKDWVADFSKRAKELGEQVKDKYGQDMTVNVFEVDQKNYYVFGDSWARGTEILYQAMGLKMPEKVKQDALKEGYYQLSSEVLPEYAGDFVIVSRNEGEEAYKELNTWKSIPAVKNNHVIEIDTKASTYSDPTTLEYLLDIFKEGFLK